MGIYKEYLSGEEMVSLIKAGLVSKGAVSEDAKVSLSLPRHSPPTITIDDSTIKGNEKEWTERKRKENRTHWKILGVMIIGMTLATVAAVGIANYLTSITVIEQEETHPNGL